MKVALQPAETTTFRGEMAGAALTLGTSAWSAILALNCRTAQFLSGQFRHSAERRKSKVSGMDRFYWRLIGLAVGVIITVVVVYVVQRSEWQKKQQAGEFSAKPKVATILKSLITPKR